MAVKTCESGPLSISLTSSEKGISVMNEASSNQTIKQWEIHFPGGQQARAICCSADTPATLLPPLLGIPQPGAVLTIAGGAFQMDEQLYPHVRHLLVEGVVTSIVRASGMIIDGGTFAGVMRLIGEARAAQPRAFPLLGVSPAGCVIYPEKPSVSKDSELVQLDPNHSHFVLVDAREWGGETSTMYNLVQLFSKHCPSVALVVNGGTIARHEVLYNVRQQRPVIVIEGSGRVADEIARASREQSPSTVDPELAEIITHDALHLFPLAGSPADLARLVQHLLH
jgi:hypothetical protein